MVLSLVQFVEHFKPRPETVVQVRIPSLEHCRCPISDNNLRVGGLASSVTKYTITLFHPFTQGGGADLPPPRANAYIRKNHWVEILIILGYFQMYIRYFSNHFYGQKTFRWSETPYFHKGCPYEWCQSCL